MRLRSGSDRGQATVELALVLPVLALLLLGVLVIGVVATAQVSLENAAREAARAAAVEPSDAHERALDSARRAHNGSGLAVTVEVGAAHVTVRLGADVPVVSMIPGLSSRRLRADATFRREDLAGP